MLVPKKNDVVELKRRWQNGREYLLHGRVRNVIEADKGNGYIIYYKPFDLREGDNTKKFLLPKAGHSWPESGIVGCEIMQVASNGGKITNPEMVVVT